MQISFSKVRSTCTYYIHMQNALHDNLATSYISNSHHLAFTWQNFNKWLTMSRNWEHCNRYVIKSHRVHCSHCRHVRQQHWCYHHDCKGIYPSWPLPSIPNSAKYLISPFLKYTFLMQFLIIYTQVSLLIFSLASVFHLLPFCLSITHVNCQLKTGFFQVVAFVCIGKLQQAKSQHYYPVP